jgi:hypothetical protein
VLARPAKLAEHSALGNQCIAALKAYGLLDVAGSGKTRKAAITEDAERIVRRAPDRSDLLRQAAVLPSIHKELLDEYADNGLPPDEILHTYLVWERDGGRFNEDVVDDFIGHFRETLEFAGIEKTDKIGDGPDDLDGQADLGAKAAPNAPRSTNQWSGGHAKMIELPISLPSLNIAVLRVPEKMSQKDYDRLKQRLIEQLEDAEESLVMKNEEGGETI